MNNYNNFYEISNPKIIEMFWELKNLYSEEFNFFDPETNEVLINDSNDDFLLFKRKNFYNYLPNPGGTSINFIYHIITKYFPVEVINDLVVSRTLAGTIVPWHNDGSDHTDLAPEPYKSQMIRHRSRRNIAINFNLTGTDLSTSKLSWAKPSETIENIRKKHYSSLSMSMSEFVNGFDTGEGLQIFQAADKFYDESLIEIDESKSGGFDVPTLIRTDRFHEIDNSNNDSDRTILCLSFPTKYRFEDVIELINSVK